MNIARALAPELSRLVLDESTNHLDVRHRLEMQAPVRRLGVKAIVALHDFDPAALICNEIALLRDGRLVVADPPEAVLTETTLREVLGVRAVKRASMITG